MYLSEVRRRKNLTRPGIPDSVAQREPFLGLDTEFFPDMADYENLEGLEFSTSVIVLLLLCQSGSTPRQGVFSIPTKGS